MGVAVGLLQYSNAVASGLILIYRAQIAATTATALRY